jgi:hypothetical protein
MYLTRSTKRVSRSISLARASFLQIASKGPERSGHALTANDVLSETDCERLLAFTSHDRTRIAREMLEPLRKPPFTNQLNHSDQLLRLAFQAESPDENPQETSGDYQWAIAQNSGDRVLRYNYGLFLFGYDRNAAIGQLCLSLPWDGFPVFTPDGMMVE